MIADAEKNNPESSLCFSFARLGLSMFQFLFLHQQTKTRFFATCCSWWWTWRRSCTSTRSWLWREKTLRLTTAKLRLDSSYGNYVDWRHTLFIFRVGNGTKVLALFSAFLAPELGRFSDLHSLPLRCLLSVIPSHLIAQVQYAVFIKIVTF